MTDETLTEIVGNCLAIDIKASKLYFQLSNDCKIEELRNFWGKMSREENEHVEFWKKLLPMAKSGMLPQIFDEPEKTKKEIEIINNKIDALLKQFEVSPNISTAFVLAYRMEFYLLHPAFETLFHFTKTFSHEKNPEDSYRAHLSEFVDMISKHAFVSQEIEILGEAILHLWNRNKELIQQGSLDELTRILNRRGFFYAIKPLSHLAQRTQQGVAILMTDVDDFKKINDKYGHQTGDKVLKTIATILKSNIRKADIIGRYGGEEFIIYLSAPKVDSVKHIAEKIRESVEKDSIDHIPVTISIGVAIGEIGINVDDCVNSLIQSADTCLYDAKKSGKNKVVINFIRNK